MSHFTVAVIHRDDQDIEDLLAPFDENLEVEPYVKFTRQEAIDYVREHWLKEGEDKTDDECWTMMASDYNDNTDDEGNIYSTYNPDSKWDWYQVGGRWSGMLRLRGKNKKCDSAKISDVSFRPSPRAYKKHLRFWDVVVEHATPEPGEEFHSFYNEEYFRKYFGDRDTYAKQMTSFSTYAVITPDGVWHGKGDMGWWGMSSETPEEANEWENHYLERFIDTAEDGMNITIVDCHI